MACARFRKQLHPRMHMIKAISTLVVLLASMVVVGWAEPPSADYSFELVHVDAHRGFSSDELMRRAANRSRLRAATMYPQASAASGGPPPLPPRIRSPGGLCMGEAEYFMKFYFDGATDATSAMMDTGSDIIWTTQQECRTKGKKKEPLRCADDMCKPHANCQCDSKEYCQYDITYGEGNAGKTVQGHMYKGKLSFLLPSEHGSSKTSAPMDVTFGCSTGKHFKGCSSPPMTGLVGLGRGDQSLPKQLKVKSFSYCLNNYMNPNLKSILLLYNNPAPDLAKAKVTRKGAAVVTTPLGRHPDKAWYFVHLENISIGPTSLLTPDDVHPQKEGGNMFIDSGASYTFLQEGAFEKVVEELDRIMVKEKQLVKTSSGDDNCYSGKPVASMPKMKLHFANSAVMELPWESYLWQETESSVCLFIKKMPKGNNYHVLGNFQQQSIHMLFEIENEELKFVPADCSKVR